MADKTRRRKKKKTSVIGTFVSLALIICTVACGVNIVSKINKGKEMEKELVQIQEEIETLRAENTSYEDIINESDERAYMEKIATEVLGYAYPSERRFYDTTRS